MIKTQLFLLAGIMFLSLGLFGQQRYKFSGTVSDSLSKVNLDNVDVVIVNQSTGTITSSVGDFLLYLEQGTYNVAFIKEGYRTVEMAITVEKDVAQKVSMQPDSNRPVKSGMLRFRKPKIDVMPQNFVCR